MKAWALPAGLTRGKAEAALQSLREIMVKLKLTVNKEMGWVQISTNRAAQGIADCERALVLDRNLAAAQQGS